MEEFLGKPYSIRQFIVVERDEIIATKLKAQEELIREQKEKMADEHAGEIKHDALKKAVEVALGGMKNPGVIGIVAIAVGLGAFLADVIVKSIEKQRELSKRVAVNYISFTQSSELKFPIGHPRENELYVAHPTLVGTYYPMNEFHKKSFEHKFAELNSLLMDLGAKKVSVEYISGWDFNSLSEIEVAKKGKGKLDVNISKDKKIIYNAEYDNNESRELPKNMAWYYHEPTWQSVGEGRLNHDLQNFNLLLEYNDDFGINAELFAEVAKIGFGEKSTFKKKESTVWKIVGEF